MTTSCNRTSDEPIRALLQDLQSSVSAMHARGNRTDQRIMGFAGLWRELLQVVRDLGHRIDNIDDVVRSQDSLESQNDARLKRLEHFDSIQSRQLVEIVRQTNENSRNLSDLVEIIKAQHELIEQLQAGLLQAEG